MSTDQPQSLDPDLVEQTKQHIRSLVNEIAQLARTDISPQEFYAEFLSRVVSALAAVGGVVWTTDDDGRLALQYQINLQKTGLADDEAAQAGHSRLLSKVMSSGEPMLIPANSGSDDDEQAANKTDYLLVIGPLSTDIETVGVVEVFQRPDAGLNTQKGYLRFLMQMCDLAAEFIKSRQLRHFTDRQVLWTQLEEFSRTVHSSLEPRQAAYTIANEGRRLIECDRVSVAIRRGSKCTVEAISGQDLFDKRSNIVRLLGKLATAVVVTGEPVWYSGDTSNMAPQVEDAIQEYIDESHSKTVAVLPLVRQERPKEEKELNEQDQSEEPVGALIVEQIEDSRIPETMLQRVEVVSTHSSIALANAMEHQNLFLMPVWRAIGNATWMLKVRTLPKTISVAILVVGILLGLIFWPANFALEADGELTPVQQRDVFARVDGTVADVFVKHGEKIKENTLLAKLRNTDLEVAITDILGRKTTTHQQILSVQRSLLSSRHISIEEQNRLSGELLELKQQLKSLDAQLKLYQKKKEELNVDSPSDGIIVTWDVFDKLIHRPVQRGQVLMQVANPEGLWELELRMPEDRMGHIVDAQRKLGDDLKVTFILATNPNEVFEGRIKEIHYNAEVRGEDGNTVLIEVSLDKDKMPDLRPGSEVTAKVYCGRRSIGYVYLHDLFAFVQRILFRL